MTTEEYRAALTAMTDEEYAAFAARFGGSGSREERVAEYARDHAHEGRLCELLGIQTEAEKWSFDAKASARWRRVAAVAAAVLALVAVATFILSRFGG